MADSENGSPDDVVFNDEGSFYDPDDQAEERGSDDRGAEENGEAEAAVGAASPEGRPSEDRGGDDRHPRRRRRRRRRSRRGGGGPDNREFQPRSGGQPHGQRPPRRGGGGGGGGGEQNGQYDQSEREGAPVLGTIEGILELHPKGYGFLRDPKNNYASGKNDPFVPATLIDKYKLREGSLLKGEIVQGHKGQGPRFRTVETVDGRSLEEYAKIRPFDELTAVNPFERIRLETGSTPITMRVMDLLTPLGKGQRALIVAPPRTGKTMLLQEIANSVSTNHP
jgi:transcription termination factor Rho